MKPPSAQELAPPSRSAPTLEQVYRDHADFVWRLLRSLGVDDSGRDDAFHEVFIIVHRRLADYDGRASLPSWLFGIARNVALHHRRSYARHLRRLTVAPEPTATPGPDEVVAELEARALVDRFLGTLGEEQRLVFILAELEGLRVPEIADQLGVNLNTLYSRLNSARKRFASFVAGGRHGSE